MTRRVLFLGAEASVFVSRTRDALQARGVEVSVVDPYAAEHYGGRTLVGRMRRLWARIRYVRHALQLLDPDQTAVMHYLSADAVFLIPMLKRRFKRVVGLAYGSDILRRKLSRDRLLALALRQLDEFAATNSNVLDAARQDFPFLARKDMRIIRFGLPVFDAVDALGAMTPSEARRTLGFPENSTVVSLGYSASPGQRQEELLAYFRVQASILENCIFVVPVQYGDPALRDRIVALVNQANADLGAERFFVLTEFHGADRAALMRRATGVLINYSVSDAFSGTVQEVVFAGNLVFASDHLPYAAMPGYGSAIVPFSSLSDLAGLLAPTALDAQSRLADENLRDTVVALRRTSSWDGAIEGWLALIDGTKSTGD